MQEDQTLTDRRSTLLRLLGIERWLPRDRVLTGTKGLAPPPAKSEPSRAGAAPAVRRRVEVGVVAPPVSTAVAMPSITRRVNQEPASSRWHMRLDLHVCAGVLAVLEQNVELPQRFVRDICNAVGGRYEALQALEDFSWPPAGNVDLAQRDLCRSALLAVLTRRWQAQQLSAVLLLGPTLLALCGTRDGTLLFEEQAGMRLLLVADPEALHIDAQRKRELWSLLQRGPVAGG